MESTSSSRASIALVLDPRFPGGTSTAVAHEIRALSGVADLRVFALETAMFKGRKVNPALQAALEVAGIEPIWNPPVIRSELVFFHNPSCLRFNDQLDLRISCDLAFAVAHENFLRPNGSEGFDVAKCLRLIDAALICRARYLAPISAYNRRTVEAWARAAGCDWPITELDHFNVCDFKMRPPVSAPRDRRGRHSRPGFEKFPSLDTMLVCFPAHAESCVISGADHLLASPDPAMRHWRLLRWEELEVDELLDLIDFYVYWTNPLWREGFGRVIAEAIAAGKVVLTDPGTAEAFGEAVVGCELGEIDRNIREFIARPDRYRDFVGSAQARLAKFGPKPFLDQVWTNIDRGRGASHALL